MKTTIDYNGKPTELELVVERYTNNNRIAIRVLQDGCPFGMLTTNVPFSDRAENEVIIKTFSENRPWAQKVVDNLPNNFEHVGHVVFGFVKCPIYRFVQMDYEKAAEVYLQQWKIAETAEEKEALLSTLVEDDLMVLEHILNKATH